MQQTIRKSVSWLLTLAMIFSMLPGFTFTVLAAEHLCAHHTEHTADCGYEAGVSDCTYHCDICLEHDHGEPAPAAVCTCETDDPDWHAPFCDAYVAPEDPQCYCVEVCGDFVNDYCDVCYFDAAACAASGEEEAALFAATPTYIASIGIDQDGSDGSTGVNDCKEALAGHTIIDRDLNDGAGGDYVYMGYKTTTDPSKAITGIVFRVGGNPPDSITYGGYTFNLVGGGEESNTAKEGGYIDLNAKAGGDYIYMYVTRDSGYGAPLISMTVSEENSKSGYTAGTNTSGAVIDLNQKAGGKYLYLHYKRATVLNPSVSFYTILDGVFNTTSDRVTTTMYDNYNKFTPKFDFVKNPTSGGLSYQFVGWREDRQALAPTVTTISLTADQCPKYFYAVYTNEVSLTFDANGGTGAPSTVKGTQFVSTDTSSTVPPGSTAYIYPFTHGGVSIKIPEQVPTKSGACVFSHWNRSGDGKDLHPGETITWYFPSTLTAAYQNHSYVNGICTTCGIDICSHNYNENGFCNCTEGQIHYQPAELKNGYYQIKNGGNLFWFAQQVNVHGNRAIKGILTADINLENRAWTPIGFTGETNNNFRGHFDGNGKIITGLNVQGGRSGLGFFGEVCLGTVENFTIYGEVTLTGKHDYVGGVIGSAPGVKSDQPEHNGATIRNITSYVDVTLDEGSHGSNRVGGFIGYANHATLIENCAWYGTLDLGPYRAQDGIGGLLGKANDDSAVTIRNCGAYGTIKTSYQSGSYNSFDTIYIGGIVSNSVTSAKTVIENTLWAGTVVNNTNLASGKAQIAAFGTLNGIGSVTNCYALADSAPYLTTNGTHDGYDITTKTAEELKSGEVAYLLQGTQDTQIWGQTIGTNDYPILGGAKVYLIKNCKDEILNYSNTDAPLVHFWSDNGFCTVCDAYEPSQLVDGAYQIGNAGQLYWFAQQVNDGQTSINGKLTANIVVNENVLKEDGTLNKGSFRAWTPIGNGSQEYAGTFDGDGKTVSGLYFNNSSTLYVGLFGCVNGGTVKNVGVIDAYISGRSPAGGVVGYNYGGTVSNCYNTGTASGINEVGGVVGCNTGTVSGCYNTGTVSGSSKVGGVVGYNETNSTVSDCYNTGDVFASGDYVGGVVGYNNRSGSVSDCYNTGAVSGRSDYVGGVVGYNYGGTVSNCYNTGTVSGSSDYVGGVVGYNNRSGSVSNCYNTGAVSGSSNVGGVVGKSYKGSVSNCYYDSTVYTGDAIGGSEGETNVTYVEGKATQQFTSGEVAYLLGAAFGQIIGEETCPLLGGAPVYAVTCGGSGTVYSNTNTPLDHVADDDGDCTTAEYCTVCGQVAVAVKDAHTPGEDDGDCTTAVKCVNCEQIAVEAKAEHVHGENGQCAFCGQKVFAIINGKAYLIKGDVTHTGIDINYNTPPHNECYIAGDGYVALDSDGVAEGSFTTIILDHATIDVRGIEDENAIGISNEDVHISFFGENNLFADETVIQTSIGSGNHPITITGAEDAVLNLYGNVSAYAISVDSGTTCLYGADVDDTICAVNVADRLVISEGAALTIISGDNGTGFNGGILEQNSIEAAGTLHAIVLTASIDASTTQYALTAYGDAVLGGDTFNPYYDIDPSEGMTVTMDFRVPAGTSVTIPEGITLNLDTFDQVVMEGELIVEGTLICSHKKGIAADGKCNACGALVHTHAYDLNGFCSCGDYQPATLSGGDYWIDNAGQLYWFAQKVNGGESSINGKLTKNIVVNEAVLDSESDPNEGDFRPWTPIGTVDNAYSGTFDGQNHTISGLYFSGSQSAGLFGEVNNAKIQNVTVADSYFYEESTNYVGGIVGKANGRTYLLNCHNVSTLAGLSYVYTGGIAGSTEEDCVVENCSNSGKLSGYNVGGIVCSNDGTISNCFNTGSINGSSWSGGIASSNSGTIEYCYNTDLHSNNNAGIAGTNISGTIRNCHSLQSGIVAYKDQIGTIENCYYRVDEVDGEADSAGIPKTGIQFFLGEVAYLLGDPFGQFIGEDDYPTLGGDPVYWITICNGQKIYSNKSIDITEHNFEDGWCTVCGTEAIVAYGLQIDGAAVTNKRLSGEGWSYDPENNALTLNGFKREGEYESESGFAAIFYEGDEGDSLQLILQGENEIVNLAERAYGVYISGDLSVSGDGSLSASSNAMGFFIYGALTMTGGTLTGSGSDGLCIEGDLTMTGGKLIGNGETANGIGFYSDVTLKGGEITGIGSTGVAIYGKLTMTSGKLTGEGQSNGVEIDCSDAKAVISDGTLFASVADEQTGTSIIIVEDAITINGGTYNFKPADAWMASGYGAIENADGTWTVKSVETYGLWVGGKEVTEANLSGEGWSYDPATNLLTLNHYTYSGEGYNYSDSRTAAIYAEYDLNIVLIGENCLTNTNEGQGDGIRSGWGTITIGGDGSLEITALGQYAGGISAGEDLVIRGGSLKLTVNYDGLYANWGNLTIKDSTVDITTADGNAMKTAYKDIFIKDCTVKITSGSKGIYAEEGNISIADSAVEITAAYYGICTYSDGTITISGKETILRLSANPAVDAGTLSISPYLAITNPGGTVIYSADGGTIWDAYGYRADEILIRYSEDYVYPDIYVGGAALSDGKYLANGAAQATGTKPASGGYAYYKNGILTLHDYTYKGKCNADAENYGTLIHSDSDIEILLEGKNRLTNTSMGDGIYTEYGSITIGGEGSLEIIADTDGIYTEYGDVTVESGTIKITTDCTGIYAYSAGSVTISGGSLEIISGSDGIYAYDAITISGGEIKIDSEEDGIYAGEGNIVVSGGEIKVYTDYLGICAYYGDITVSDGDIEINSYDDGMCTNDGSITINGGSLEIHSDHSDGLHAYYGVTIRGGIVNITAYYYGISTYADVTIGGDAVKIQALSQLIDTDDDDINIDKSFLMYDEDGTLLEEYDDYLQYILFIKGGLIPVSWDTNGDGKIDKTTYVNAGDTIGPEDIPQRSLDADEYAFSYISQGWVDQNDEPVSFEEGVTITEPMTYYAMMDVLRIFVGCKFLAPDDLTVSEADNDTPAAEDGDWLVKGGTATYDPETNTLTLEGFHFEGIGFESGIIYYEGPDTLKLVLKGENKLVSPFDLYGTEGTGISTGRGSINITGPGSLFIQAPRAGILSADGSLTFESGTVTVDSDGLGAIAMNSKLILGEGMEVLAPEGVYAANITIAGLNIGAVFMEGSEPSLETIAPDFTIGMKNTITVSDSTNGTVTADKASAAVGELVTLTITPDKCYLLDTLTVMQGETPVEVAEDNTFIMPAGKVTVTVQFKCDGHVGNTTIDDGDCTTAVICSVCGDVIIEAKASHSGSTATCKEKAVCMDCGQSYGEKNPNNHVEELQWIQTPTTHKQVYPCCGAVVIAETNHNWGGNKICTECNYGRSHTYGDPVFTWQSDYSSAKATQTCSSCGDEKSLNCEISSQWDAETGMLTFTAITEEGVYTDTQTVTLTVDGGKLTITNSVATADETVDMIILVAGYRNGRMVGCQVITNVTGSTTETLTVTGHLKIFFLKTDGSYAPLFACAEL